MGVMMGIRYTLFSWMRAVFHATALLLAVYVPTFAVVASLHLRPQSAVPVVIFLSAILALAFIFGLSGRVWALRLVDFGLQRCSSSDLAVAVLVAVPFAACAWELQWLIQEPSPLSGLTFTTAQEWLYFGVSAPFQEEVIFRGLLQTIIARRIEILSRTSLNAHTTAIVVVAVLFALLHLEVGPRTAFAAFVLGLLAGYVRQRSGSLLPAIAVHAIANLPSLILAND